MMLGGMINGTNASRAMVPDMCKVSFDRRLIPEENLDDAEKELISFLDSLQERDEDLRVSVDISSKAESMVTPENGEICV